MSEITRDELQAMITGEDQPKLLMIASSESFAQMHIPGSLNASGFKQGLSQIARNDNIVLYGCNEGCSMTRNAYKFLTMARYPSVSYYVGGLADWKAADLPLEGEECE